MKINALIIKNLSNVILKNALDDEVKIEDPDKIIEQEIKETSLVLDSKRKNTTTVRKSFVQEETVTSVSSTFLGEIFIGSFRKKKKQQINDPDPPKEIIIYVPKNVFLAIMNSSVKSEDEFILRSLEVQTHGLDEVRLKKITANSLHVMTSGVSKVRIGSATISFLVAIAHGQSSLKIKDGAITHSTLTLNGASTIELQGKLTNMVVSASGISSCRYSSPGTIIKSKGGSATIKSM